jgi:hypothetical protein
VNRPRKRGDGRLYVRRLPECSRWPANATLRSATAYGSSRLHAPERGSARSPARGWPATSGGQHRQAPRRRAEDSSEALGNSAEALGNSARGDRCTGAQTEPGNGASVTFSVSISFSTTALRPTAHDLPKTRTPPETGEERGPWEPPRGLVL